MVDAIDAIRAFTRGVTFEAFAANEQLQAAVHFKLVVIGEAASKVPSRVRKQFPGVEWKKIVGLRNIVAHAYFTVDLDIEWNVITKDIVTLEAMLGDLEQIGDDGEWKGPER
jgi:uncharacterized protein with HEPN domain